MMVDYNQALIPAEAIQRGRALEDEGIAWLEEPIRHDDYWAMPRGIREALTRRCRSGRIFTVRRRWRQALAAGAADYVMPDVARIGGVTGWMQRARHSPPPIASRCRRT